MDYHCFLQCGINFNLTGNISTERWTHWKRKLNIGKDWISSEMYYKALTRSSTLSSKPLLQQSWKTMKKENVEKTPTVLEQQHLQGKECQLNVCDHHLNVYGLKLVGLYIIRINAFGAWKVLTKKTLLETLKNSTSDANVNSFWTDGENFKDTKSISKMNYCVSHYLSLLKLYLLFPFAADLMYHISW